MDSAKKKALEHAVRVRDLEGFRCALRLPGGHPREVTVTSNSDEPVCLLTLAAECGHAGMVAQLLAMGCCVEGRPGVSYTPLISAARHGHAETVQALLDAGADPVAKSMDARGKKRTALHYAALKGHIKCVSALLPPVTTHNITDSSGHTPLHCASQKGYTEVLRQLRKAGEDMTATSTDGWSAVHYAAVGGRVETLQYLVEEVCLSPEDIDKDGYTPADHAKRWGHHDVENWLLKRCGIAAGLSHAALLRLQDKKISERFERCITELNHNRTWYIRNNIPDLVDAHLRDEAGRTLLHLAAAQGNQNAIRTLTEHCRVHPHVLTHNHMTPADLADQASHTKARQLLSEQQCNKNLPDTELEKLYEKLLTVIKQGDDMQEASKLMCAGAPLEPVGDISVDALALAVRCGRSGLVSLLLAAGAPLTSTFQGCNLLVLAWTCANQSIPVTLHITKTFQDVLRLETDRAPKDLRVGLHSLMATLEGDHPWHASWPPGQSQQELSALLLEAVKANCSLTARFLVDAGASPFFLGPFGCTILHEALSDQHKHLRDLRVRDHLTEMLVRDLGACLYLVDEKGRLPTELMTNQLCQKLQKKMYGRERRKLREVEEKRKSKKEQERIKQILYLQQFLYNGTPLSEQLRQYCLEAMLLAARLGLQQLTWLLQKANVAGDAVVEPTMGTTALHQAAAHGKTGCVALLLRLGADASRCDRYGFTPAHLAAMFGHESSTYLLKQHAEVPSVQDHKGRPPSTVTITQMQKKFDQYLQMYMKLHRGDQGETKGHEDQDEAAATRRILNIIKVELLEMQVHQVMVRFKGEAKTVHSVVEQELQTLIALVTRLYPMYRGHLELAGSSSDGTKLVAPDEFDYNLVLDDAPKVRVIVEKNSPNELYKGKLKVVVEADESCLQGNHLMSNFYEAMNDILSTHTLTDSRLSLVPPGLTRTQVGVALSLAWQGHQYPLLLVGVDLVPVLRVPWHPQVKRPALTPTDVNTLFLSNTEDGSWRCSFAITEAQVLCDLDEKGRFVFLTAKTLLALMRSEPWFPREKKAFFTWWCDGWYKIPVPKGFCLKNSFLRLLEIQNNNGDSWDGDTLHWVTKVFRQMCNVPDKSCAELSVGLSYAYFGGDCEGPKVGDGAPQIVSFLESVVSQDPLL